MPKGKYPHKKNKGSYKKGHKGYWSGRKRLKMTTNKIRKSRLARKAKLGYLNSSQTRKKISKALMGHIPWHKGKTGVYSKETRKKMSEAKKSKKHPNWKGGISKDKQHYGRERRIRKLNATGFHTLGEWENLKAQYNWTCPGCGKKEPKIKLEEDHVIPLTKGGSDNIENIQPLCRSCNAKKYTKIIKYKKLWEVKT